MVKFAAKHAPSKKGGSFLYLLKKDALPPTALSSIISFSISLNFNVITSTMNTTIVLDTSSRK